MTKADDLFDALGRIDDDLIPDLPDSMVEALPSEAEDLPDSVREAVAAEAGRGATPVLVPKRRGVGFWIRIAAGVTAAAVLAGVLLPKVLPGKKEKYMAKNLALPSYPEAVLYPDAANGYDEKFETAFRNWLDSRDKRLNQPTGYRTGFDTFFRTSTSAFLEDKENKNLIYSPLSLYIALGMAAETSSGNTRQQILNLLGESEISTLREHEKSVFIANYVNDGAGKCVLGNSVWLNIDLPYVEDTVKALSEGYFASVYSGDPTSEKYEQELRDWINAQTDNLLSDAIDNVNMDKNLLMMLVSTVNFSAHWKNSFNSADTKRSTFQAPGNKTVECDFMNAQEDLPYYAGENYTATELPFENGSSMRLILPDKGVDVQDLLQDEGFMKDLLNINFAYRGGSALVELSLPKFDITSESDLIPKLQALGITDAFDATKCDLSSITTSSDSVSITQVKQDVRVMIDEEGCKGVAVTMIAAAGVAAITRTEKMVLDRPFIFEIVSDAGMPLFVGVVNDPTA